jgi:hypothetical protein
MEIWGVRGPVQLITERFGECACCGEKADLVTPQAGTREWYQLPEACSWMAAWQRELGQLVFPKLRWRVVASQSCGIACGFDKHGVCQVIFDLMHPERLTDDLIRLIAANDECC